MAPNPSCGFNHANTAVDAACWAVLARHFLVWSASLDDEAHPTVQSAPWTEGDAGLRRQVRDFVRQETLRRRATRYRPARPAARKSAALGSGTSDTHRTDRIASL